MHNLTIYLLLKSVKRAQDAISGTVKHFPIHGKSGLIGDLFVKPGPQRPPKWSSLFSDFIDVKKLGQTQSTSGVLIVSTHGRLFALAFGSGRFLLDAESYEERFGLLVTLNSVAAGALRSIDKHTFDAVDQNSRVQANQLSTAFDFGVDVQRDLVRGIVGQPTDPALGKRLAGADSLAVTTDAELPSIKKLLGKLLDKYASTAYRDEFGWVDHIHRLRRNGSKANELNEKLVQKIEESRQHNGIVEGCWVSIPEIIDWSRVAGFMFTRRERDGIESDLHLPGFVRSLKPDDVISIDLLKDRNAYAVDDEGEVVHKWPVHRCLHCEIKDADGSYVFSAGHWFAIDKSFVGDVEAFFKSVPSYPTQLLKYNHASEALYNEALATASDGMFALMDLKLVKVGGIYDKIEFCDVYSKEQEMFHIKRYGNSNVLGHLFNQGLVSGELLRHHGPYPALVNEKLPKSHYLPPDEAVPRDISAYSIVFAIISQSDKPLHLPFFALVSLRNVHNRLANIGFNKIFLAKIESNPDTKIIKVLPKKRHRARKVKR